jgi:hypothetical protein
MPVIVIAQPAHWRTCIVPLARAAARPPQLDAIRISIALAGRFAGNRPLALKDS